MDLIEVISNAILNIGIGLNYGKAVAEFLDGVKAIESCDTANAGNINMHTLKSVSSKYGQRLCKLPEVVATSEFELSWDNSFNTYGHLQTPSNCFFGRGGLGEGNFLLIYIYDFHVLNHFLLIYICKLHWRIRLLGFPPSPFFYFHSF